MLNEIRRILKKYSLKPKKYWGQNFLINDKVLKEIIKVADLKSDDIVLEIGPGLGNLTKKLAGKVEKVVAVEKDEKLIKILKERLAHFKNIEIIRGDILKLTTNNLRLKPDYKVVANLPYYITSPVIRKFLESESPPGLMILMVQKEVAQRICAKPPKMTLLSVAVQFYSLPKIVKIVKKDCFWPEPKVDSAIIKLVMGNEQPVTGEDKDLFFKIVKAGFSQPRKQLKNNLEKISGEKTREILEESKINETCRSGTLRIEDWINICENFKNEIK